MTRTSSNYLRREPPRWLERLRVHDHLRGSLQRSLERMTETFKELEEAREGYAPGEAADVYRH